MSTPTEPVVDRERPIVVSAVGDDIRISPAGASSNAGLRSALDVAGGLLTFDVAALTTPPSITITDLAAATSWLDDVYGPGIATLALEVAGDGETRTAEAAPSATADSLARLAFGAWMLRWWPLDSHVEPLDLDLLRVELAALAWDRADVFLDRQPAGELLGGDVVAALTKTLAWPEAIPIAATAAQAAVELWGPDHDELREVEEFVDVLAEQRVDGKIDLAAFAHLSHPAMVPPAPLLKAADFALAADLDPPEEASDGVARARNSVDWIQVPARVLDWSEDTIELTLRGRTLSIAVTAAERHPSPSPTPLFARVYDVSGADATFLPIALLRLTPLDDDYRGKITLDRDLHIHDIAVDVYAAETVRAPRLSGGERKSAEDSREAMRSHINARSLERTRPSADAPVSGPDAPFLAERA